MSILKRNKGEKVRLNMYFLQLPWGSCLAFLNNGDVTAGSLIFHFARIHIKDTKLLQTTKYRSNQSINHQKLLVLGPIGLWKCQIKPNILCMSLTQYQLT